MSDVSGIGPAMAAASQSLRDTAKWLVGGVVATAAGVFAGTSLTAFGSLNPLTDTARFGAAIGGLLFGFVALAFILGYAVRVLTRESMSLAQILSSGDNEIMKIKAILERRYKDMLPRGAASLKDYRDAVGDVVKKEQKTRDDLMLIAQAGQDNDVITADASFYLSGTDFKR